jgi:hypothetical protein
MKLFWTLVSIGVSIQIIVLICIIISGCSTNYAEPVSASNVKKATVEVETNKNGHTTEQANIIERYHRDNKVGSLKHLYVISAYSGQVILYSTVDGKVTSSGKRLSPTTVQAQQQDGHGGEWGFPVNIGGEKHWTAEVLQDDGTYGSSSEYIYWFDSRKVFHTHYISGGQIVHISDEPIAVKSVVLNLELAAEKKE